ncbi:hypothetical protein C8R44DRAFT_876797 [Mycena epipterygia]|nr:hypothetical protein C8R44DRAFT_876797 [Mycena epipterygia]
MHPKKSLDSAPFLSRTKSFDSYTGGDLTEQDFDPDGLEHRLHGPRPRYRLWLRSKLIGWTGAVIVRGEIPLHLSAALWIKNNSHLVTLFTTLISTILAGCSSFFFSYAFRRSVVIYLYRPMSLGTLGASVSIATRSLVFQRGGWKWSAISLLFFFMTGIQTSGPVLQKLHDNGTLDTCVFGNMDSASLNAGQTESGYASANGYFGYPSVFTLMNQSFNVSTGGILPAAFEDVDASTWFSATGMTVIPPTVKPASAFLSGLSTNYWTVQQVNFTTAYTTPDLDYRAAIACTLGNTNYTLISAPNGTYATWLPSTLFTVVPKVTTTNVDYGTTINVADDPNGVPQDLYGPGDVSAIYTITQMVCVAQAISTNAVGSNGRRCIPNPTGMSKDAQNDRTILQRSVRIQRISKNATFLDSVPANMTIPTTGVLRTETLGWTYVSKTAQWFLLPRKFIALATVVLVVLALHRHGGDIPRESEPFDPSNPLHLVAAAAAGGLTSTFQGLDPKAMKDRENLSVR